MNDAGFIYAIGPSHGKLVKIGSTGSTVKSRLRALQTGSAERLEILGASPVDANLQGIEKTIHRLLDADRHEGEWFAITVDQNQLEVLIARAFQWLANETPRCRLSLGQKIEQLRRKKRFTQTELASRAQISQALISRLEGKGRHNVNADVLKRLATALGCTTDYLVGMHEDDVSESKPTALDLAGVRD